MVDLEEEAESVELNIDKETFWNPTCRELISVRIGKWLIKNHLAPWPAGQPPVLNLIQIGERHFFMTIKSLKGSPDE